MIPININTTKSIINGLSVLKDPSATIPTAVIEAFCTSGRTYQSYKRGGKLEAKERFREEATCGFFWLFGAKGLNKLGDYIGKKFFGLDYLDVDIGRDELRNPFSYISSDKIRNKTAVFKFCKIITSIILTTGLLGFVVPKINHAITKNTMEKNKEKDSIQKPKIALDDFLLYCQNKQNTINFSGKNTPIDFMMTASHYLENNNACRLISSDAGMIVGRVANSRHPAEGFEYLFRDLCSIFFYNFSTFLAVMGLNKLFKTTNIHPKAIEQVCKFLENNKMSGNEIIRNLNLPIDTSFEKIGFEKNGTILLSNFIDKLKTLGIYTEALEQRARQMSTLQPQLSNGEYILSRAQVRDVFSQSITADPKFLKDAINAATGGRATDKRKFVDAKTCQNIRESLDGFIKEIARKAGDSVVDKEYLEKHKILRNALCRTTVYQIAGMVFSIFGLAILIPKLQIFLSQKLYGKKSFEDIANGNKKSDNKAAF